MLDCRLTCMCRLDQIQSRGSCQVRLGVWQVRFGPCQVWNMIHDPGLRHVCSNSQSQNLRLGWSPSITIGSKMILMTMRTFWMYSKISTITFPYWSFTPVYTLVMGVINQFRISCFFGFLHRFCEKHYFLVNESDRRPEERCVQNLGSCRIRLKWNCVIVSLVYFPVCICERYEWTVNRESQERRRTVRDNWQLPVLSNSFSWS